MTGPSLSVIIPAHNEAAWITGCLEALFRSEGLGGPAEAIVIANGCSDDTVARARAMDPQGWSLSVIETGTPGKLAALNRTDAKATGACRIYLDADVIVSDSLIGALARAVDTDAPRYATGTPQIAPVQSPLSNLYGRFWAQLPFVAQGTPGFGVFAVNAAGRARWGDWPDIIADDMFARLNFAAHERVRVPQHFAWPPVSGFFNLVRVRRRQNAGVAQLVDRFPALMRHEDTPRPDARAIGRLALRDPIGFGVYAAVLFGVRAVPGQTRGWARGR